MGTLLLDQMKKQASSFLQEKYKTARLVFSDVTEAELLAEEATNDDPCIPDARTMTKIAQASMDLDDYWRIADVLHKRLDKIDWKQWRQTYKSLVLLDFLLTHGSEAFAQEFKCDYQVIQELGKFEHKDEKGFDWGMHMRKRSERILDLLQGGETLKQARLKALKIMNEIQGFGNSTPSPPSSSSSSSEKSRTSSFGSLSTPSPSWYDSTSHVGTQDKKSSILRSGNENFEGSRVWDCSHIKDSLLNSEDENEEKEEEEEEEEEKPNGFISGICSKLVGLSPSMHNDQRVVYRSFSDVGRVRRKKIAPKFPGEY